MGVVIFEIMKYDGKESPSEAEFEVAFIAQGRSELTTKVAVVLHFLVLLVIENMMTCRTFVARIKFDLIFSRERHGFAHEFGRIFLEKVSFLIQKI